MGAVVLALYRVSVAITKAQAAHAEWALDAMRDVAGTDDFEYDERDLPRVVGGLLLFPTDNTEVVEDLLYRLEEQLPSMAAQDSGKSLAQHAPLLASARALAGKLRRAMRS